jgi:hypothetical protein
VSDSVHIRLVQERSWVAQMSSVLQPTAFSGSHQDAIRKGMARQQPNGIWEVPYLPIDAFVSALDMPVRVMDYHEHVMTAGADARARAMWKCAWVNRPLDSVPASMPIW